MRCYKLAVAPRLLLLGALCSGLAACGGGGSGGSGGTGGTTTPPPATQPPTVQSGTATLQVIGVASSSVSGSIAASDPAGRALTYSVSQPPAAGSVSLNPQTGAYTYTLSGYTAALSDQFSVSVSNGSATATGTVQIALPGDPLLQSQWYIKNTGASAFSSTLPAAGNDMNVASAWVAGYSGKGVKVAIIDSGLESGHEDLSANVEVANSYNFITGRNDPSRLASDPGDDHGTQVAGIIGAVAFNGKGGRGVAFRSTLRGYNYLATSPTITNYAKSFGSDPISADNDVFNASFFVSTTAVPTSLPSFSGSLQAISGNLLTLRGGKGAVQVIAAGNEFKELPGTSSTLGYCSEANQRGMSCGAVSSDERRGGFAPIVIGAINADGVKSSYSTTGSSLWVSAPGGEYGLDSTYMPGATDPANYRPAIVSTARPGCSNSAYPTAVNALDAKGANPMAPNCQYTATMNGTSSAAPNVSAVVALMLEANPQLSYRDVRYILAKTAKKIDQSFSGRQASDIITGQTVVLEQGWITNAAGWSFSNWYGFGAVDAGAAVAMAKTYTNYLPALVDSSGYQVIPTGTLTVPKLSTTGLPVTFLVNESFRSVEHVVVFVNIAGTPLALCNQIELTSPSGTKSILLNSTNGFQNRALVNVRFLSNAFYGESPNGTWTLRFFDFCGKTAIPTALSSTQPQVLGLVGH